MSYQKERMARIEKEFSQMNDLDFARHGVKTHKFIAFLWVSIMALLYAGYFFTDSADWCLFWAAIYTVTLPVFIYEYFSGKNKVKALESQRVAK